MTPESLTPELKPKNHQSMSVDLRLLVGVLLVVIVAMLFVWKPWSTQANTGQTITVNGSATLTAAPDQYVFNPQYEFKNADKAVALAALNTKSNELVAKLKSLGVADKNIKSNSSGYDNSTYYDETNKTFMYTLNLTVTVSDAKLTQKVEDYLVTTSPSGQVSPTADFSTARRKQLESQARDQATKEARTKADQSAKNLGFHVGKVKTVTDSGFGGGGGGGCGGGICMLQGATKDSVASAPNLKVQPGQNNLDYSITVVYYLR